MSTVPIRFRLRSSTADNLPAKNPTISVSSSSICSSTNFPSDHRLYQCELCGQQNDHDGQRWLITCSVCAKQYHLQCLNIQSKVLLDPESSAFRNWSCKSCRSCLFCGKKRIKSKNDHLISSLRSHPERKLNSLEMISCKECDTSIHTICFFKMQKIRQSNIPPLSVRELRNKRKNFVCDRCNVEVLDEMNIDQEDDEDEEEEDAQIDDEEEGDDDDDEMSDEEEQATDTDSNHDESESEEPDDSDVSDYSEIDDTQIKQQQNQHILRNRLKKLGIVDLEKHMTNINDDPLNGVRATRSRKYNSSPTNDNNSGEDFLKNSPKSSIKSLPAKQPPNLIQNHDDDNNNNSHGNDSPQSSSLVVVQKKKRGRKRKIDTTFNTSQHVQDAADIGNRSWKKAKQSSEKNSAKILPSSSPFSVNNDEFLDENNNNNNGDAIIDLQKHCPVAGCDSVGHLSGAFETHSMIETCPLFHNQTNEECVARYQKRMENKDPKYSPRRSSQRVNSAANFHHSTKWNMIMSQRNNEMKSLDSNQKIDFTSSRQPKLDGFAPKFDSELFLEAQSRAAQMVHENSALEVSSSLEEEEDDDEKEECNPSQTYQRSTGVRSIVFGQYEISVWYNSQYSEEFQNCLKLFICEFCLKCMNHLIILKRHLKKCPLRHPPGNEIYRKGNISFFEIDGNNQKEYCQNLCLLAKLFLEYKTLFIDVEPFLFYVMTENTATGMHLIGYFSKEKQSPNNYNVSCILTLPQYQRTGYGRMLIDFSYLLSRVENKSGSPERPLSDLGIISYRSYWKFIIMEYLSTLESKEIALKDISQKTGVNSTDIVSTLQLMGLLKYWKGKHLILIPDERKKRFAAEVKRKRKNFGDKIIDPKCLRWTPTVYPAQPGSK